MADFIELASKRQSDRNYQNKPVARELIVKCLQAARLSPSACNSQPWKFIVIDEPELLHQVATATSGMGMNKFVHEAPVIVAVVLEKMNLAAKIGSVIKDKEYSLVDIGIAVGHFCLEAAELGLGTCIIGWFDEKKIKKLLGVKNKRIPLVITIGYPASGRREISRKPLEEMSSWNSYK